MSFEKWRIPLALGVAASCAALLFKPSALPLSNALLGLLIVWIGLLPGLAHLALPPDARPFCPLFALVNLFYAGFFGVPVFLIAGIMRKGRIDFGGGIAIDAVGTKAQILVVAGLALLWIGYFAGRRLLEFRLPRFRFPAAAYAGPAFASRAQLLAWGLAAAHLAYLLVPRLQTMASVGQGLKALGLVAFAILYALWRTDRLPRWQVAAAFWLWLPTVLILYLRTGFFYGIILVCVAYAVLRVALANRLPWRFLGVLAVAFVLAYPLNGTAFRAVVWNAKSEIGILGTATAFVKVAYDFYRLNIEEELGIRVEPPSEDPTTYASAIRRVSLILLFSDVVGKTPDRVPYWGGETYKPLATALIPRALWPGKPREIAGNAFGRRYGLIEPTNTWHSSNIPWIVEMYANFGSLGVLIGMTLVGFGVYALERFFARPDLRTIEKACGAALVLPLFFQESNLSLMVGALPAIAFAVWLYFAVGLAVLGRIWPGAGRT